MNRLINLLLILRIGAAVVASFSYLAIDLGGLAAPAAASSRWAPTCSAFSART